MFKNRDQEPVFTLSYFMKPWTGMEEHPKVLPGSVEGTEVFQGELADQERSPEWEEGDAG